MRRNKKECQDAGNTERNVSHVISAGDSVKAKK